MAGKFHNASGSNAMMTRALITLSVALNFAMMAVFFWPANKNSTHALIPSSAAPVFSAEQKIADASVTNDLPFSWDQVAADDLNVYRDNLRDVGCPETTVRQIMRAVINHIYGGKRQAVLASFENRYWDLVLQNEFNERQTLPQTEWGKALTELAAGRQQAISDVLGPDALAGAAERQKLLAEKENRRAWLTPSKRAQLAELERKQQQRMDDWFAKLGSHAPTEAEQAQLADLQQEFASSEKTLLTPEEFSELQLRESDAAGWAANLPNFNPTEDEWRTLATLRSQYENFQNSEANAGLADEDLAARQAQLQSDFDASVKQALGPERFAQYQLANNPEYQTLHNVTKRYGLSDDLAAQGLDVQQSAQKAADDVRANSGLSPGAQQAALLAIQEETQKTLSQMLGQKVFATYQEYSGDWLPSLVELNGK